MVWSSASSTLIGPFVVAFVFRSSPNTHPLRSVGAFGNALYPLRLSVSGSSPLRGRRGAHPYGAPYEFERYSPECVEGDSPKFGRFLCALWHLVQWSIDRSLALEYAAFVAGRSETPRGRTARERVRSVSWTQKLAEETTPKLCAAPTKSETSILPWASTMNTPGMRTHDRRRQGPACGRGLQSGHVRAILESLAPRADQSDG